MSSCVPSISLMFSVPCENFNEPVGSRELRILAVDADAQRLQPGQFFMCEG